MFAIDVIGAGMFLMVWTGCLARSQVWFNELAVQQTC